MVYSTGIKAKNMKENKKKKEQWRGRTRRIKFILNAFIFSYIFKLSS